MFNRKFFYACAQAANVPQSFVDAWAKYQIADEFNATLRNEVRSTIQQLTFMMGLHEALKIPMPSAWNEADLSLDECGLEEITNDLIRKNTNLEEWLDQYEPCQECQEGLMCPECRGD